MAILQPERFERIVKRLLAMSTDLGLSERFIEEFMNTVHQESIRRQSAVPDPREGITAAGQERPGGR
jgi:chorismate mutase